MPELTPVKSSNISAVGYEEERELLTVQFSNGATFEYAGISPELYGGILEASSVGKFFHRFVKPRALTATEIKPKEAKRLVDIIKEEEEPHALAGGEEAIPDHGLPRGPDDVDEEPEARGA